MSSFAYKNKTLHVEDVSLSDLADQYGTPLYVYSAATIKNNFDRLYNALRDTLPAAQIPLIAYACKANSHLAIMSYLGHLGAGADVVSGGELKRALKAGIPADKIVFSGVGKSDKEIKAALNANIRQINIESAPEISRIMRIAEKEQLHARVAFRINPDVDAKTHAKITTGKAENKFGIEIARVKKLYAECADHEYLTPTGLSIHIGSQLTDMKPFREAFEKLASIVTELRADGHIIDTLDLGGGVGIVYHDEQPADTEEYARIIKEIIAPLETKLILEPGRYLVGDAGVLVTKVQYIKDTRSGSHAGRQYMILDAGMNNLMRPSLYDAYHPLIPIKEPAQDTEIYDVVGPICETGDTFHKGYETAPAMAGDYMALGKSGAYSSVMASFYNAKDFPAEIFIQGKNIHIIRESITLQDIMDKETIPEWNV